MMCDCVYCQGDKPWSGDPDEWPHTPPVYVFLALQDKDPNLWWRMPSGHGQNIAEDAIDMCEELINENKLINAANGVKAAELKRVLLDLIAELRRSAKGYLSPGAYAITVKEQLWLADWAEARLREVSGDE